MTQLAFNAPLHSLSFGQVSIAILREIHKRGLTPAVFPIANDPRNPIDLSAQRPDAAFTSWLSGCVNGAQARHSRAHPTLRLWHIADSLVSLSSKGNDLITFQETGQLTSLETHILHQQRRVYVTNRYAQSFFSMCGVEAVHVPLGFDAFNFSVLPTRPRIEGVTSWLLCSKAEKRKHTYRQLGLWAKRYGNRKEHKLNLVISNPFLKPEDQNALIAQALEGKAYWNINPIQWQATNAEYNAVLQSSEIVLCCSGSEGFGLPEYHAAALGAWPVALKAHAYLDYFTEENAVLVKPNGMQPIYDGIFFTEGQPINQGATYTFSDEAFYQGCEEAERRAKGGLNTAGLALQKQTYEQTVDVLLSHLLA